VGVVYYKSSVSWRKAHSGGRVTIGLSPPLHLWNGGADLATPLRQDFITRRGQYRVHPHTRRKAPGFDPMIRSDTPNTERENQPKNTKPQWSGATASSSMIQTVLPIR